MRFKMLVLFLLISAFSLSGEIIKEHKKMVTKFKTPQEVTKACIECHKEEANSLFHSRHFRWEGKEFDLHGKKVKLGKKTLLNNFCININSNEPRCTSCHTGYGWKKTAKYKFKKEDMDCLVCHDQTGTYKKFPTKAGYPVYKKDSILFKPAKKYFKKVDLLKIARSTKKPTNKNCGTCHFNGGGGHGVKPGDMDKSLIKPSFELDVHMGNPDPEKRLTCGSCHVEKGKHKIKGALHASMAANQNHLSCIDCHKDDVHKKKMKKMLNLHTKTVSCETCHIPKIAKKYPTKTWWDWSTAGDKKRKVTKDEYGKKLYMWKKGDFKWEKDFSPEYYWYNGKTDYYLLGEEINDPSKLFTFNKLEGNYNDGKALISPFKVMRGKQFYDKKSKQILIPHLFGKGGYWKTLDWNKSFKNGMESVGLDYSGEYGVIETEMFWPIDHMVAPAEKAVQCVQCHTKDGKKGLLDWKALGYSADPVINLDDRVKKGIVK